MVSMLVDWQGKGLTDLYQYLFGSIISATYKDSISLGDLISDRLFKSPL